MIPPAIVLILLTATACAALAHVLLGRAWRQIPIFWVAAVVGCLIVYGLGLRFPLTLPTPAGVPLLESVLMAWVLLIFVSRLRV